MEEKTNEGKNKKMNLTRINIKIWINKWIN